MVCFAGIRYGRVLVRYGVTLEERDVDWLGVVVIGTVRLGMVRCDGVW